MRIWLAVVPHSLRMFVQGLSSTAPVTPKQAQTEVLLVAVIGTAAGCAVLGVLIAQAW